MTQPEPNEATTDNPNEITGQEMMAELGEIHADTVQQLAGARVVMRKQQKIIEQLQAELTSRGDSGATS